MSVRTGSLSVLAMALALAAFARLKTYEVKWVGELHKVMMLGEDQGIIALDSLQAKPHLYALGPVEGLNGEITVFDSEPIIATVRDGQTAIEKTFHAKAPLLVYAQVARWTESPIPSSISNLADLSRFVEESARKAGIDMTAPFPFRVTARAAEVKMHIVNRQGREAKGHAGHEKIEFKIPLANVDVELIGFWSDKLTGVMTHMGSNIHVHGRTVDNRSSGHLDEVKIESGRLWLPATE